MYKMFKLIEKLFGSNENEYQMLKTQAAIIDETEVEETNSGNWWDDIEDEPEAINGYLYEGGVMWEVE